MAKACEYCGAPTNDDGGYSNPYDPNVDGPPYVKPERVLRAESRQDDFRLGFRALATFMKKQMVWDWEKAKPLMVLVLHSWDQYCLDKFGPDRGFDCSLPVPTKWEKQIQPLDWLLIRFADNEDVVEAIALFDGED